MLQDQAHGLVQAWRQIIDTAAELAHYEGMRTVLMGFADVSVLAAGFALVSPHLNESAAKQAPQARAGTAARAEGSRQPAASSTSSGKAATSRELAARWPSGRSSQRVPGLPP